MIRTTYWTINSKDKRPDEDIEKKNSVNVNSIYPVNNGNIEEMNKSSIDVVKYVNSQVPIIEIQNEAEIKVYSSRAHVLFRRICLNWICGFDLGKDNKQKKVEAATQIHISREETKCEKWILNINLVIIILISIFLFIFYSVPNHNVQNLIHLNQTSTIEGK